MMVKSVSYVTHQVTMMRGFNTHVVINKFTCSPDPALIGGLILAEANLTLSLDACPSVEDFVMRSGLGPGRLHSLPLVGGLYHAQWTLTAASRICPLSKDFVLHSGVWPRGPQELPLVGELCHAQQTLTTNSLRNCPLSEDFVWCSGLWPQRASRNCLLLEDLTCIADFDH